MDIICKNCNALNKNVKLKEGSKSEYVQEDIDDIRRRLEKIKTTKEELEQEFKKRRKEWWDMNLFKSLFTYVEENVKKNDFAMWLFMNYGGLLDQEAYLKGKIRELKRIEYHWKCNCCGRINDIK